MSFHQLLAVYLLIVPAWDAELLGNAFVRLVETVLVARINLEDATFFNSLSGPVRNLERQLRLACSWRPNNCYCRSLVMLEELLL